jgi:uncharacterized Zn-binding protein involved in type VI secretion
MSYMEFSVRNIQKLLVITVLLGSASLGQDVSRFVGRYSRSASYVGDVIALLADSTYSYDSFLDVGGWRPTRHGRWTSSGDTVFLTSVPYPELNIVAEYTLGDDSLCVEVQDSSGLILSLQPRLSINGVEATSAEFVYYSAQEDNRTRNPVYLLAKRSGSVSLRSVGFDLHGRVIEKPIRNPRSNRVLVEFNCHSSFFDMLFHDQPFLWSSDSLFWKERDRPGFVRSYPLLRRVQ